MSQSFMAARLDSEICFMLHSFRPLTSVTERERKAFVLQLEVLPQPTSTATTARQSPDLTRPGKCRAARMPSRLAS